MRDQVFSGRGLERHRERVISLFGRIVPMDIMMLGIIVLVVGVVFLFALFLYAGSRVWFGQRKGEGFAPGWQVRCPACGLTVDAGKASLIAVWAKGSGRRLGRCSHCNVSRWLFVERVPNSACDGESVGEHRG